jgi:hypothetical protein
LNIKPIVALFLLTQAIDGLTTIFFMNIGGRELNPLPLIIGWKYTIAIKIAVTAIVALVLQKYSWFKLMWLVVVVPLVVSIWNVTQIVTEIIMWNK